MESKTGSDFSLVQFSISPVQGFIAAARTVRDLWSGSYLISWLTAHAMAKAVKGGGRLMSKAFEEDPLVVLLAAGRGGGADKARMLQSCLPNTFLVEVPGNDEAGIQLADAMKKAALDEWRNIADAVYRHLDGKWRGLDWDPLDGWKQQVEDYWEVSTAILPASADVEALAGRLGIKANGRTGAEHLFFLRRELIGRLAAAQKMVRHVPRAADPDDKRPKCFLFGTDARMGPVENNTEFWEKHADRANDRGERLQPKDRLGAIGLVKRFAWGQYLCKHPGIEEEPRAKRSWDTATITAAGWIRGLGRMDGEWLHQRIDARFNEWSGQWLFWPKANPWEGRTAAAQKDDEACDAKAFEIIQKSKKHARENGLKAPPSYYAVLMLDGDNMGDLFRHATRAQAEEASRSLAEFARVKVPGIISDYLGGDDGIDLGQPIYAGGDDVLAMLPIWIMEPEARAEDGKPLPISQTVLHCAQEINKAFCDLRFEVPTGSRKPTTSAGLVIAHYKEDLREVLETARAAEKNAKNSGKNCLCISVMRRSGEHSMATLKWEHARRLDGLVKTFLGTQATDRWAYQLRSEMETGALSTGDMIDVELARLLSRSEKRSQHPIFHDIWKDLTKDAPDAVKARENALTLIMSASFMARGREE